MKKQRLLWLVYVLIFLLSFPAPLLGASQPAPWGEIGASVKASSFGALDGFLQTHNTLGSVFTSVRASLLQSQNPDFQGTGWSNQEERDRSAGFHHNQAIVHVLENIVPLDIRTDAGKARTDQLLLAHFDTHVLPEFLASGAAADGVTETRSEPFIEISLADYETIIERIVEAKNNNQITEKFYQDLMVVLEILETDSQNPKLLVDAATDYLWREVTQRVSAQRPSDTLSLNFEKIKNKYEALSLGGEPEESEVVLNDASEIVFDILSRTPQRFGVSPETEVREMLAAIMFIDVCKNSFKYYSYYEETDEPQDPQVPRPQTSILLTIDQRQTVVNGESVQIDVAPFIENNRTMLPFRFIGEQLGADVEWMASERKVTYRLDGIFVELWIDQNKALVDGEEVLVDSTNPNVTPVIRSSRTMVPVRFISESLGFDVEWDEQTRMVTIQNNSISE